MICTLPRDKALLAAAVGFLNIGMFRALCPRTLCLLLCRRTCIQSMCNFSFVLFIFVGQGAENCSLVQARKKTRPTQPIDNRGCNADRRMLNKQLVYS